MSLHKEIRLEVEICEHLAQHGWLHAEADNTLYDRPRALFAPDLVAWIKDTQPTIWEALSNTHGSATETVLLDRLRKQLDAQGTLEVLRKGIELVGLKQPVSLAQFKPASGINADLLKLYNANRLRVIRQVRYRGV